MPSDAVVTETHKLLDLATNELRQGRTLSAFRLLGRPFTEIRAHAEKLGAIDEVISLARSHDIFPILQEDPYTARAYAKPRGYAGDAVMLDYVYDGIPPAETSDIGRACFFGTTRGPMGLSVLYRRSLLKAYLDHAVVGNPDYRILSVASGHCRELEDSLVLEGKCDGEFVAMDGDPESCDTVRTRYLLSEVRVEERKISDLLVRDVEMGKFHLIYATGLYDYLNKTLATRLTNRLIQMLATDGLLLIGNFMPSSDGRAYMDAFMDWQLFYRDEADLADLFANPPMQQFRTFADPHQNVCYAELRNNMNGWPSSIVV